MRPSQALARHRDQLLAVVLRHGGVNPRIFGSVARGDDAEGSDLDLLIDCRPGTGYLTLARLQAEAEEVLGVPVDLHTAAGLKERIRGAILAEARPL